MRSFVILMPFLSAATLCLATGCAEEENCGAKCLSDTASLRVNLRPAVARGYDVELVLDGEEGSFTCADSVPTDRTGVAESVVLCRGSEFGIDATPESVEITVTANDDTRTGALAANPDYVTVARCPGGSVLCAPFAIVVVELE